ncbi:glycosyltransferase [Sinorhizobium americanum]|uniref:Glycosyl transferase family protein n=1 Tax=Sinorhizobium americanum TaxID=194963 RepID=A0A1L3LIS3_9HYPH|nr:glycosyltransferase [Sinorhizobium americanum]APG90022.1 glycosyl transferase family protein [Sinorhizobium americanum]OAP42384.1 glycosyl transferase [Sinorhizobium americanum]
MSPTGEDISIHFQSERENAADIELVVVVPTWRRPDHLVKTLKTIVSQRPDVPYATVVAENDPNGLGGAEAAKRFFLEHRSDSTVIVAHRRGHSHACNAGWAAALDNYPNLRAIAVIYDDAVAAPEWLDGLVAVQEGHAADIVGGPQLPVFEDPDAQKWKHHPIFSPHYDATGPVPRLFSAGNVLITRAVLDAMPRPFLNPALNFAGVGDGDFFNRCRAKGFSFAWAAEAWVAETVPRDHTTASWIRARSLEQGAISTLLEHQRDATFAGRLRTLGKSVGLIAASLPRGLKLWSETGLAMASLYPFHVAVGRLTARIGRADEQYRGRT